MTDGQLEWVLVPAEATEAMMDQISGFHPQRDWQHALAARPPIPTAVLDAMVERGARAICDVDGAKWDAANFNETQGGNDPEHQREGYRLAARACILSALSTGDA